MRKHLHNPPFAFVLVFAVVAILMTSAAPAMAQSRTHVRTNIGPDWIDYSYRASHPNGSWGNNFDIDQNGMSLGAFSYTTHAYLGLRSNPWGNHIEMDTNGRYGASEFTLSTRNPDWLRDDPYYVRHGVLDRLEDLYDRTSQWLLQRLGAVQRCDPPPPRYERRQLPPGNIPISQAEDDSIGRALPPAPPITRIIDL